jgi:hypothetical protein
MRPACRTALVVAIDALVAAPAAHGAKPKLYDDDDDEVDEHHRGQERFRYTLTVRRVR